MKGGKKGMTTSEKNSALTKEVSRIVSDWTDGLVVLIGEGNADVTTGRRCFTGCDGGNTNTHAQTHTK